MKKIADFFKANRYAIIWTLCYILVMKFILSTLFNFDMFSTSAWQVLAHSHLYGFGGFVFGLLVLAVYKTIDKMTEFVNKIFFVRL